MREDVLRAIKETEELSEKLTDDITSDIIAHAVKLSDRRMWLCKNAPCCEKCGTRQIQLVRWYDDDKPAIWKCRRCKHRFEFEPAILDKK